MQKISKRDFQEIADLLDDTSYVITEDVMKAYKNKNYDLVAKYMISVTKTCKDLADKSNTIIEAMQAKAKKCD